MARTVGHSTRRTLLSTLLLVLAVAVLPLSTLVYGPLDQDATPSQAQLAPAAPVDSSPSEDPVPGPSWANQSQLTTLWPPSVDQPRSQRVALRRPGHLRRIDRPPRG